VVIAAFDHPEEGVANEGVGTDGGGGKRRQRGDRRVGGEGGGSQASAEVAVSDDAELLTALDQRAGLAGVGHRGCGFGHGGVGAHQTMGRIWWRARRNA
jgi:hypothetical protein